MQHVKKKKCFNLGWVVCVFTWFCLMGLTQAASESTSSCVVCHTHYGKLKKSLAKTDLKVSPLIEGMG